MMGNKEGCLLQKKEFLNQQSGIPEEDYCAKKVVVTSISHLLSILLEALLLKVLFFSCSISENHCRTYNIT